MAAAGLRRLVPLADRVLVRRVVPELKTAGGVLLPESGVKKNEGEVVAVGPGALDRDGKRRAVAVAVGDTVLLPEYGGHTVKMGDQEFQLFRDEDILGKFEN
ncbi:hypothetical protein FNF27_02626 [Cafeteria roenbergensis]|uniref:10 kDa chaperonin n=2 Tax=Cafeteria roenbergensis TaxID=33653 RepID=A0A5A8EDG3_CAFRO|nr:hypothetical protein FNF29_05194 [Cafeteria roenbergensis]KAA0160391.1 hypothetical protein FNF28_05470 [Cafeteria roenbergensis]KAA0160624.1 hypothetical protein FNF31_04175 [Cafeteria roenbergensis]KAA0175905.1 hypothetical protein FNF27_02626 [Cafeteria roenbergensis]|eukprot:KAA0150619.1 hypothetical protein FNF29_05194 [Cafeteria roenbergensis]